MLDSGPLNAVMGDGNADHGAPLSTINERRTAGGGGRDCCCNIAFELKSIRHVFPYVRAYTALYHGSACSSKFLESVPGELFKLDSDDIDIPMPL